MTQSLQNAKKKNSTSVVNQFFFLFFFKANNEWHGRFYNSYVKLLDWYGVSEHLIILLLLLNMLNNTFPEVLEHKLAGSGDVLSQQLAHLTPMVSTKTPLWITLNTPNQGRF